MKQNDFIEKRNTWLKEVSNTCHEFALKCDLDYYVFQTPCEKYNPELLIIGINPGGGNKYSEVLKLKGYNKRPSTDLGYDVNTLTTKPVWEDGKGNDKMRSCFRKVFSAENNLNQVLESAVMMNMYYFNTPNESGLNAIVSEYKKYCVTKTLEFIEILNPKNILFLTSSNTNLQACGVNNIEPLANNVKKGYLNNRLVFAMPHYTYFGAYSDIKSKLMGKTLGEVLDSI